MLYDYIQNKFSILNKKNENNAIELPRQKEMELQLNKKYRAVLHYMAKDALDILNTYEDCLEHQIDIKTKYEMNKKFGIGFELIKYFSDETSFGYRVGIEFSSDQCTEYFDKLTFAVESSFTEHCRSVEEIFQKKMDQFDNLLIYFETFKEQFYQEVNQHLDKLLNDDLSAEIDLQ